MLIFDQLRKDDRSLRVLAIVVLCGMVTLVMGLWYVQLFSGRRYREDQQDQAYRSIRVPALRGKIVDRNGIGLAENRPNYTIQLYLEELRPRFEYEYTNFVKKNWIRQNPGTRITRSIRLKLYQESRYRAASNVVFQLSEILDQPLVLDENKFHEHHRARSALPMPIVNNLTPQQVARFMERKINPPAVDLDTQPIRYYPYQRLAAHVLGHLRRDDSSAVNEEAFVNYRLMDFKGVIGIEATFDQELRGRAGIKSVLVNSQGYRVSENVWTPAEAGKNVVLTLDLPIQQAAEAALKTVHPQVRGAAIVLDAGTGSILAMASQPSFDPNVFLDRISPEEWKAMNDEKMRPMINRATKEDYPPGSVFKMLVALAALEAGVLDPAEVYHSTGEFRWSNWARPIRCTAGPGEFDFRRAFIKSSNPYFIEYGLRAGVDRLLQLGRQFDFGERTGIPLNQETSGLFFSSTDEKRKRYPAEPWHKGDTANLCIGQGFVDVTPLQVALMTAAVCNGGKLLKPRVVESIEPQELFDESGRVTFPPEVRRQIKLAPRHWRLLQEAMFADVEDEEGTAFKAFHGPDKKPLVPGMRIGGKTGTAQQHGAAREYITWFASFGHCEGTSGGPYVVIVMVEGGGSGGGTCAPVARRIYQALQKRVAAMQAQEGSS